MDLNYTEHDIKFRDDVRNFIKNNLPLDTQKRILNGGKYSKDEIINWQKALFKNKWFADNWPNKYGGCEWTAMQ